MPIRLLYGVVVLAAIVLGFVFLGGLRASNAAPNTTTSTQQNALVVRNVRILDQSGNVAYQGDVDIQATLNRIQRGERDPHRNDGVVHTNREGKLPRQAKGYYREYVIRTPNVRGVGPQRLIVGKGGELYYTPNHYQSFTRLR